MTRESITHDLEQFHAKGIGGVVLINSTTGFGTGPIPSGPKFLSPEWRALYRHALDEAARLGLEVGVNFSTGWCMGGPWIKPEDSGRWFLQSTLVVDGPQKFSGVLPLPGNRSGYDNARQLFVKDYVDLPLDKLDYRDSSIVAFPEPDEPDASMARGRSLLAGDSSGEIASKLAPTTSSHSPSRLTGERAKLLAAKSNRLDASSHASADEVMSPTLAPWVSAPDDQPLAPARVIDLTSRVDASGRLEWEVPPGRWVILRTGHRMTGARTAYALPEAAGLEVDWLSERGVEAQFKHLGETLLAEAGLHAGKTLRYFHEDSFEDGFPNWTAALPEKFRQLRGYDPTPYLPIFSGRIVESAEVSDRFLYDYRRTVADLMADAHYGRFAELCRARGLEVQNESAGPSWSGTMCMDTLKNLGRSDRPMGEFWQDNYRFVVDGQNQVTKTIATAAHIYGQRTASAEAFTTFAHWSDDPAALKPTADRAFCEGINRIVFHTSTATHPAGGKPGFEYGAGTHFNPNITWWEQAGAFVDYLSRCQHLLQAGRFVADVLYYNGDGAPNIVKPRHTPADLGAGYDYDVCNTEVLLTRLDVKAGRLVLPSGRDAHPARPRPGGAPGPTFEAGMSYRVLVLPDSRTMPVEVARKLRDLVQRGATIIGRPPERDPGLHNYPACDEEVRAIAAELWAGLDGKTKTENAVGPAGGRVVWGRTAREILAADRVSPDFTYDETAGSLDWIHRTTGDAEIYFVVNRNNRTDRVACTFRASGGGSAELWNPVTGEISSVAADGSPATTIGFAPRQSWFVVFRHVAQASSLPSLPEQAGSLRYLELNGPWTVAYDPRWGGPRDPVTFPSLTDWIENRDERIRFYSGTATYRKQFSLPAALAPGERLRLDLGVVKNLASVRLNGIPLGIVWTAPWEIDLTRAARAGDNALEIDVVNLWPNRLIGDKYLPTAKKITRTNVPLKDDAQLLPSGLIGPVQIFRSTP